MTAVENSTSFTWQLSFLFATSAGLCIALIMALRPLLRRYAMARPNARSSHKQPTPQGGGIAVIGSTTIVLICIAFLTPTPFQDAFRLSAILAAAFALAIVGATDDIRPLGAFSRLFLQSIAVMVVLLSLPSNLQIVSALPLWLERALMFVALLWFVNLVNFMDGIDWMSVAEIVPVTGALTLFGVMGALPHDAMLVSLSLFGAMIGFAPFNRPVARLFLGDVGSLPIGLLLGWLLVLLAEHHFVAALLLPLYYLADATITLLKRFVRGEPVMQAHRHHFYQCALDSGFTVYQIVGRVFLTNVFLASLGAFTILSPNKLAQAVALIIGVSLVGTLLWNFSDKKITL